MFKFVSYFNSCNNIHNKYKRERERIEEKERRKTSKHFLLLKREKDLGVFFNINSKNLYTNIYIYIITHIFYYYFTFFIYSNSIIP
jgi:hypothetical protein